MKKIILKEIQIKTLVDKIVNEQTGQPEPFNRNVDGLFKSGDYRIDNTLTEKINNIIANMVQYIQNNKLKNFKIIITPGESLVRNQPPFQEPGSLGQQRGKTLKEYLIKTLTPSLSFTPTIVVNNTVMGKTPWVSGANKNDERYQKEQFVNISIQIEKEPTPTPEPTPGPTPTPTKLFTNYLISIGDQVYYFPKTLENWRDVVYNQGMTFKSAAVLDNGKKAQAIIDMKHDVFLKYYFNPNPELKNLAGPAYVRDTNNPDGFRLMK